jgi:hypothetical protein
MDDDLIKYDEKYTRDQDDEPMLSQEGQYDEYGQPISPSERN